MAGSGPRFVRGHSGVHEVRHGGVSGVVEDVAPRLRPIGKPAVLHAFAHDFLKSPIQPYCFDALRPGAQWGPWNM
jgi:hypothetical protein